MTMVVAYTWHDKIIMMADSRASARDDEGKMVDFTDEENKIFPVQKKIVIGHSGLRKIPKVDGTLFDLHKITEYFLEVNQNKISKLTGRQLLLGLVETWNGTFIESLGRDPFHLNNRFCFLLGTFEEDENHELKPKIQAYQSHLETKFNWNGTKAVIGDEGVYPIMQSYYDTNTDAWKFDEALEFYLKGFTEVMDKVETVGGPIDIYVLDLNPNQSYWLQHKTKD